MSLAEILDTSFRILRDHFVPIVGISAILNVPVAIGQALVESQSQAGAEASLPTIGLAFGLLSFALVSPLVGAAITHLIGELYLGREARLGESFRVAFGIFVPLLGTMLLVGLFTLGATLLLIIPGIWFGLGATLTSQIMVLERSFGMTAIRRSLDESRAYALERKTFGVAIAQHQAVQFMLADMATGITAGRLLTYHAAAAGPGGTPDPATAAMARLHASSLAVGVTLETMRIHGGYGYVNEFPVERFYRDAARLLFVPLDDEALRRELAPRLVAGR
jgi:hypothetical protein